MDRRAILIWTIRGHIMTFLFRLCAVIIVALEISAPAQAAGIPIIYQLDSYTVEKVADLPQTDAFKVDNKHLDVGYAYKAWSFYWMPFWASSADGYVLYSETPTGYTVIPLTPSNRDFLKSILGRDPTAGHSFSLLAHIWGWAVLACLLGVLVLYGVAKARSESTASGA